MIVNTTLAGLGTGGGVIRKTKLRSQDVALTLHPLPASVISLTEKVMNFSKRILGGVHGGVLVRGVSLKRTQICSPKPLSQE